MGKRLQVILQDPSVAALWECREILRAAVLDDGPTADIDQMLAEIERAICPIRADDFSGLQPSDGSGRQLASSHKPMRNVERLVTDAEVLQEILHRYVAILRADFIQPAFEARLGITDHFFPIDQSAAERAKPSVRVRPRRSARSALRLAAMQRQKSTRILTLNSGFEGFPGLERIR